MIQAGSTILASDFITTSSGAGSSGKVAKLNSSGNIDISFRPAVIGGGQTTWDLTTTGAQTIAHGLGVIPKFVKITAQIAVNISTYQQFSQVTSIYTNSTESDISMTMQTSSSGFARTAADTNLYVTNNSYGSYTITVDTTNITITKSRTNAPSGTAYLLWEALA